MIINQHNYILHEYVQILFPELSLQRVKDIV